MRILHVIENLDPRDGGLPKAAASLAAAQAGLGHEVGILSYTNGVADDYDALPGFSKVRRLDVPAPSRWEWLSGGRARRLLGEFDPAFAHLHGVWDPLLRNAAVQLAAAGVPRAQTPHGMLQPVQMGVKRIRKGILFAAGWRAMLRNASFLHALNAAEAANLAPLRFHPRIEIVPNGIFAEEVGNLPPAGSFHQCLPALRGAPYILFLGRLHWQKGASQMLAAFQRIAARAPAHLVMAGPDGGLGRALRQQAEAAGLAARVHFPGLLSGTTKWAALRDASCLCLPSPSEGFSMVLLEAAAAGVPVVMSPECHFPELARAGAAVECPREPGAMAAEIVALLADDARRATMGRKAAALVMAKYQWPGIAQAMLDLYSRRPPPGAHPHPAPDTPS